MKRKEEFIKYLLIFSLIWIIIDGVFRKWIFPGLSSQIFVIKYILFGLTYFLHLLKTGFFLPKIRNAFQIVLAIFIMYCFFLLFYNNPFNTSFLVRIFGVINYLFFIPLILIVPFYFKDIEKIEQMIKFLAYLSIPIFIIGILQYFLPVDHILNYLPNEEQKFNRVAQYTRSMSIFSFVKVYNVYLVFVVVSFLAYIYYLMFKGKSSWLYIVLLALGILNLFMTGSRLPMAITLIFIFIMLIYFFLQITQFRKTIVTTFLLGIILSIGIYSLSNTFKVAVDAFITRSVSAEELAERGRENYSAIDRAIESVDAFKFANQAGYLGLGIGITYQGTGNVLVKYMPDIPFEEEGERIVLEIGIIGGILNLLLRFFIFIYAFNILVRIKNVSFAILIIPFVFYLLPSVFFLSNNTFNYLEGFSYWFSFALVLSIRNAYQNKF
jgi:hypothetical protein